ncbi:hypothetical protein N8I77_007588 [Diaporthe amygdali]|uniref:Uncharacterized protein n=1 Tax=Phomopsis amygdali TaxID=1214568 RepID=A0AAD9SBI6_PHOAM|nr:hypothetical protein N8I77_007588 [Diaporthe amygdali]KAK2604679.1 hypothetical protein N8I77_007588 [Diaporthe amygdali]
MAEQDKYASHWGSKPNNPTTESVPIPVPRSSGAEQDRFGSHWGSNASNPTSREIPVPVPTASGAEQDRWATHLSRQAQRSSAAEGVSFRVPTASGAEQDRYAAHLSRSAARNPEAEGINVPVWSASGAEQDRYASHWSRAEANNPTSDRIGIPVRGPSSGYSEQEVYAGHFTTDRYNIPRDATAVGILKNTLLPSLGLHSSLGVAAYAASRVANRVDGKDWLWPVSPVVNAWWSAVGIRVVYDGVSIGSALSSLAYPDKVLLGGITAWGARLFYQVASRSSKSDSDDGRYLAEKQDPGFWNKAFFKYFLPEAIVQAVISLPFTLSLRNPYASARSSLSAPIEWAHDLAVFVFSAGFALEVLADYQLNKHKKAGNVTLNREGVWSIVRHPNYLGDALVHFSFPLFLWGSGKLHPITLLAPAANYAFLRYTGGDAQTEAYQEAQYAKTSSPKANEFAEYKATKNSFWPKTQEAANPWTLAVIGAGAVGLAAERTLRHFALQP